MAPFEHPHDGVWRVTSNVDVALMVIHRGTLVGIVDGATLLVPSWNVWPWRDSPMMLGVDYPHCRNVLISLHILDQRSDGRYAALLGAIVPGGSGNVLDAIAERLALHPDASLN